MITTIDDIILKIQANQVSLGITTYPGASPDEISFFERSKTINLPNDLKIFYSYSNGFESDEDLFRIIPLNEILENKEDNYIMKPADFHIAEYMTYCDMWTISIDDGNSNNYLIYRKAADHPALTDSFSLFLERFLIGGVFEGLYKWEEEIFQNPK